MKEQLKAAIKAELLKEAGEKKDSVGWGNSAATYVPGAIAARIPVLGLAVGPAVQHAAINIDRNMQGKSPTKEWVGTALNTGLGETLGFGLGAAASVPIMAHASDRLINAISKKFGPEAAARAVGSPEFAQALKRMVLPVAAPLTIGTMLTGGYLAHHASRNHNEQ